MSAPKVNGARARSTMRFPWLLSAGTTSLVAVLALAGLGPAVGVLVHERLSQRAPHAPVHFQIDINRADAAELALLPSVGPALATRIVDDRTRRGAFTSVDELQRVKGIGPAISESLAPCVRVEITAR